LNAIDLDLVSQEILIVPRVKNVPDAIWVMLVIVTIRKFLSHRLALIEALEAWDQWDVGEDSSRFTCTGVSVLVTIENDNEVPVVPEISNVAPKMARKTDKYTARPVTSHAIASSLRVDDEVRVVCLLSSFTQQISQGGDCSDGDGLESVKVPSSCPATGCPHKILTVDDGIRQLFKKYQETVKTKGVDSGAAVREEYGICIYVRAQHKLLDARIYAEGKGWPTDIDFASITPRVLAMRDDLHRLIYVEGLKSKNLAQRHFNKHLKEAYPKGDGFKALSGSRITTGLMADKARVG
jgi:hypothetical protein